jgi:hypothetical protein
MAIIAMLLVIRRGHRRHADQLGGGGDIVAHYRPGRRRHGGGLAGSATTNAAGTWAAQACEQFRAAFAKELGVDESALTPAAKAAAKSVVDSAVAAGRITKARGDKLKERIDQEDANGCGLLGRRVARIAGTVGVIRDGVEAAADALKLTPAQLAAKLRRGRDPPADRERCRRSLRHRHGGGPRGGQGRPRQGGRRRRDPAAA